MKYLQYLLFVWFLFNLSMQDALAQSSQEQLKQMRSSVTEKIDGKDYYIHTIKRGQTLYMISKAYGVDVNEIIRENPFVKDGIRADEKLRIPVAGQKATSGVKPVPSKDKLPPVREPKAENRESVVKRDSVVVELPCGKDLSSKKPVYNVALMIPLYLDSVDRINAVNPEPGIIQSAKPFQFLPYYEGFRMAVDSLAKSGLKIKLHVYDVDKDTAKIRQLLRNPEMKTMDMIFGLLYHSNFQIVAAFAKKNKINLINPISERSELLTGNPSVFKVQASKKSQFAQLASYMSSVLQGGQMIIIRNGQYGDHDAPEKLKKECLGKNVNALIVESQEAAIGKYARDKPNYVVVFSDNQAYVLDLLRGLYKLRNEYDLTLVGLPAWPAIEGMENEYLVALKTHMMARSFVDYDNPLVKNFIQKYLVTYKADPELLAFQGFDQAYYLLSALHAYGTNIGRCIGELKIQSLVTKFNFIQTKENGFENNSWMIFKYENYKLTGVN